MGLKYAIKPTQIGQPMVLVCLPTWLNQQNNKKKNIDTNSVVEPPSLGIQGGLAWDHPSKIDHAQYLSFGMIPRINQLSKSMEI